MKQTKAFLAAAIVKFLETEALGVPEERQEGLQVAASCIKHSYGLTKEAISNAPSLEDLNQSTTTTGSPPKTVTEEARRQAEQYKNSGNSNLSAQRPLEAAEDYTRAIELDPENPVYYSNRAAAFTMQGDYSSAIEDCMAAISLNPNYAKAWGRLGAAYMGVGNADKAIESYTKASELEPDNASYKSGIDQAKKLKSSKEGSSSRSPNNSTGSQRGSPNMAGMDFASLLNNPEIMNMASQMMNNPEAMRNMMSNPNVAAMMQNMMGGGMNGASAGAGRTTAAEEEEEED